MESSLELQFLASDKLETLKDSTIDRIIGYHSQDYLENYDLDENGDFSKQEIIEAFNEVSTRIARDIDEQKRNYLSIKGKMDSKNNSLRLAHQSGNMQLVDGLLGGLLGGGLGGVVGNVVGILTKVIFPNSGGNQTRANPAADNLTHEAYESLSQLKSLF